MQTESTEEEGTFKSRSGERRRLVYLLCIPTVVQAARKKGAVWRAEGGGAAPWKQEGKMMRRLFLEAADREDGGMRGRRWRWLSRR